MARTRLVMIMPRKSYPCTKEQTYSARKPVHLLRLLLSHQGHASLKMGTRLLVRVHQWISHIQTEMMCERMVTMAGKNVHRSVTYCLRGSQLASRANHGQSRRSQGFGAANSILRLEHLHQMAVIWLDQHQVSVLTMTRSRKTMTTMVMIKR